MLQEVDGARQGIRKAQVQILQQGVPISETERRMERMVDTSAGATAGGRVPLQSLML